MNSSKPKTKTKPSISNSCGSGDSSSSSDSGGSSDDEESRKIKAAVCDNSLFQLYAQTKKSTAVAMPPAEIPGPHAANGNTVAGGLSAQLFSRSLQNKAQRANGIPALQLPSNRPREKNDEDDNSVLCTTPEFRAHVAKKLSELLEKDLADSSSDAVWIFSETRRNSSAGIWLYSDSKSRSMGLEPLPDAAQPNRNQPTARPRKRRISTSSSESSDDEKIKACVFSVSDIQEENDRLLKAAATAPLDGGSASVASSLQGVQVKVENESATRSHNSAQAHGVGAVSVEGETDTEKSKGKKKKKKKLKKKRLKEDAEIN